MRVLVCDRGSVLADFQYALREAYPSFAVDIETDAYRAVERARGAQPRVIVTDIDLSGVGGVDLIRRFRDAAPRARVVVWTNVNSADAIVATLAAGACGYVLKREEEDRVLAAIEAAGRGVIALSPDAVELLSEREARSRLQMLELEDALEVSANELERVTTAKAEFLSNVSHELRTPVTVAKGISHVLANRAVGDAERAQFLRQLDDSLDKLMGIVDGILTIAASEGGELTLELETFDLVPLLAGVVADVGRRYPRIVIEPSFPPQLFTTADRTRLTDVARHLLDNACRYSPAGGSVSFRARAQAEGTVVSVTDEGEGILREVVARAFDEPFSTGEAILRKERAGAGLGLHVARRLVVEHGGVMWADPLPGGGTRVSFCIPPDARSTLAEEAPAPEIRPADAAERA
jgi:signal transduction histidine kinase